MMLSDVCLLVAYIGPKSRTERPRKTKIGTEVAHVTRDSDTIFKVKRSKVKVTGGGAYCGGLPHSLLNLACLLPPPSGHVFIRVSSLDKLLANRVTHKKLFSQFSQNSVEGGTEKLI